MGGKVAKRQRCRVSIEPLVLAVSQPTHGAAIRVYDVAGNMIETHEQADEL